MPNDRFIFSLFIAQSAVKNHVIAELKRAGIKVTLAQSGVLFLLEEADGRKMNELSAGLRIDNSTTTGLIDRLEKLKLVKRVPNPKDRRSMKIFLTPKGADESQKAKVVIKRINEAIRAEMPDQCGKSFIETLARVTKKFS